MTLQEKTIHIAQAIEELNKLMAARDPRAETLAIATLQQALEIQHPNFIAELYLNLSTASRLLHFDYMKGLEYAHLAYDSLTEASSADMRMQVLYNMGLSYSSINQHAKAHHYTLEAIYFAETLPERSSDIQEYYRTSIFNLSEIYDKLGLRALQKDMLDQCYQWAQDEQDALLTYHCRSSLGLYYFKTEQPEQAHLYFDRVLADTSQPMPNELMAIACHHKGLLYMQAHEWTLAKEWLQKGLSIRNTIGNEYRKLPSYFALTQYYYHTGERTEAEQHYAETQRLLRKYGAQLDTVQRTEMTVELLLLQEDYKQAMAEIKNSKLRLSDISMVASLLHESFSLEREKQQQVSEQAENLRHINSEMNARARQLESTNQDLSAYAHTTSHDLREPLRMVSTYMQMLETKLTDKLNAEEKMFLHFAVDGSKRMDEMITRMLDSAKGKSAQKPVQLSAVLSQVKINLQKLIQDKNAGVSFESLPMVIGDEVQLMQVFQNLVSNAIKYNNSATPTVEVSCTKTPQHYLIAVADNGVGIPEAERERASKCLRERNSSGAAGTGIGLSTVKNIIEKMQGKIWIEANQPTGSIFKIQLPVV
ncbi:MAG: GHKL domain-containing protein [Bacteroidetes bacterium]|nr:GHKL domain-containing protein [Bacteroidota bacterium]